MKERRGRRRNTLAGEETSWGRRRRKSPEGCWRNVLVVTDEHPKLTTYRSLVERFGFTDRRVSDCHFRFCWSVLVVVIGSPLIVASYIQSYFLVSN